MSAAEHGVPQAPLTESELAQLSMKAYGLSGALQLIGEACERSDPGAISRAASLALALVSVADEVADALAEVAWREPPPQPREVGP